MYGKSGQYKGGKSGKGNGFAPWSQAARANPRRVVSTKRVTGKVETWNGTWGLVAPSSAISHPAAVKTNGQVYIHEADVLDGMKLSSGASVEFEVFVDDRGLGAGKVREALDSPGDPAAGQGSLPAGWERHYDAENDEYYYWNSETKESSWDPPEGAEDDDGLPSGWSKHWDEGNREWYYWHKPTKSATWDRPGGEAAAAKTSSTTAAPEPEEDDDAAAAEAEERALNAEVSTEDVIAMGSQRFHGQVMKWHGFFGWIAAKGLPEEVSVLLEGSEKIYVNWREVNTADKKLAVDQMVEFGLYTDDNGVCAADVREYNPQAARKPSPKDKRAIYDAVGELEEQWAQQDAELLETAGDQGAAEQDGADDEAQDMEAPLLPGWEQHWSEEHSVHFYWHKKTKTASWERPCIPGIRPPGGGAAGADQEAAAPLEGPSRMATPLTPMSAAAEGRPMTPITPNAASAAGAPAGVSQGKGKPGQGKGKPGPGKGTPMVPGPGRGTPGVPSPSKGAPGVPSAAGVGWGAAKGGATKRPMAVGWQNGPNKRPWQ